MFDGRRYRPMTTTDLFDEAFDLYKKNFGILMSITAIIYVPSVGLFSHYFVQWASNYLSTVVSNSNGLPSTDQLFGFIGPYLGRIALIAPPYALMFGLMVGALSAAISARYHYREATLVESFRRGLIAAIPVGILILFWVGLIWVGTMLCYVPGLIVAYFSTLNLLSAQASVDERLGNVFKAATRSRKLAAGETMRIAGAAILLTVLTAALLGTVYGVLNSLLALLVQFALPLIPMLEAHQDVADQIALNLTIMLLIPFAVIVCSMLYYDMRIRKEGYDMEILARSLGYPDVVLPGQAKPGTIPPRPARPQKVARG